MSATVQAKGVGAGFGDRELFHGVDLVVAPGDVLGLVGPNGAGKSTLLRILGGRRAPDQGTVSVSPPHAQLGYLAQEIERLPGESVQAHLERRTGVAPALAAMDAAADALAAGEPGSDDAYSDALEAWLALGGADLDARLGTVADDLGLTVDLDQTMASLSGGQAARVGLAALLLSRYDLYLLDEPTNDLDADGLDLLEEFVARVGGADRRREPRPRVPQPDRDRRRGDRPQPAEGQPLRRVATTPTWRSARSRGARRARRSRATRPGATRSTSGRGCSGPGWRRACATPGARPPTTTSTSSTSAARRPRSRPRRPGRRTR